MVTGGSRGIGAEIVRRLAADGAAVAFTYGARRPRPRSWSPRSPPTAAPRSRFRPTAPTPSRSRRPSTKRSAARRIGHPREQRRRGLHRRHRVVPAGAVRPAGRDQRAGVSSPPIQRAVPHLGDGGRIINIGSINADRVPGPGLSVYAMTKAAVAGLTRGLARDSGPAASPSTTSARPDRHRHESREGEFADAGSRSWRSGATVTRATSPAWSVIWRARTAYITGANWDVDGGFTV